MENQDFATSFLVSQTPKQVFDAVTNARGWWSEEIEGNTAQLNDVFDYHYQDVHRCQIRLIEVVTDQKVVWQVLDNFFSFTNDKTEWIGTKIIFEISEHGDKTQLQFTHQGLVPEYECYGACVNGWTHYILTSLPALITAGKGQPNTSQKAFTIHEVAARFNELAKQEKWFEIQDELFAEDVRSVEPANSVYLKDAQGKGNVRKKGEDWISRIQAGHRVHTTEPVVGGNHFAVGREVDITVEGHGRIQLNQVMVYEVENGKIILEQFFY
jgi:hypothetical protein